MKRCQGRTKCGNPCWAWAVKEESFCFRHLIADDDVVERKKSEDSVNHPSHYTQGGIECLDFIEAWKMDFSTGNVVKYVVRAPYKNGLEDLKKAEFYLKKLIARYEKEK